jgi:DNA-binding response OmpR family regulator
VGSLQIDPARREATYNTRTVSLTQQELSLLRLFAVRAGRPVSRDEISDCLRGIPHDFGDRSIDLQISRLRKKLGDDCRNPRLILTVRGIGYQLVAQSLDEFH